MDLHDQAAVHLLGKCALKHSSHSNYKHQYKFFSSMLAGTSKYKEPTHKNGKKQRASKKRPSLRVHFPKFSRPLVLETFHLTHHVSHGVSVMFLDRSSDFSSPKNISFEAVLGFSPKERHFLFYLFPHPLTPTVFLNYQNWEKYYFDSFNFFYSELFITKKDQSFEFCKSQLEKNFHGISY